MYAQFTYSAFFMVFGAALLLNGFIRRSAFLRWQALVLLAFSIGKVFTVDVSQLSQGYRILSFLGLGALLLGVSFASQRDWLNLRGSHTQTQRTFVPPPSCCSLPQPLQTCATSATIARSSIRLRKTNRPASLSIQPSLRTPARNSPACASTTDK